MLQIWAIKNNWSETSETNRLRSRHRIVQTLGPYSISACGVIAQEDRTNGWSEFRPYKDIMKNKDICGKCLSTTKFSAIDKEDN